VVALPDVLLAAGQFQNPNVLSRAEILVAEGDDPEGSHKWANLTGAWTHNGNYGVTTAIACPGVVFVGDEAGYFYTANASSPRALAAAPLRFIGHTLRISAAVCVGDSGLWAVQYDGNGGVCLLCASRDSARAFDCSADCTSGDVKPLAVWASDTALKTVFATTAESSGRGTTSKLVTSTDGGHHWQVVPTPKMNVTAL
jgi:hypothetical protein